MARQVEDQSHEESESWSTSKPLAKLEKGLAKLSVVRWRGTKHFARQNHQIRKVCQNSQGVPKFGKVCQIFAGCAKITLCASTFGKNLQNCNFFLFTPFVIDK